MLHVCGSTLVSTILLIGRICANNPARGGPDYKLQRVIEELYFDSTDEGAATSLSTVCTELLLQQVPLVVLELPFNYNFTALVKHLSTMFTFDTSSKCGNVMFHALLNIRK